MQVPTLIVPGHGPFQFIRFLRELDPGIILLHRNLHFRIHADLIRCRFCTPFDLHGIKPDRVPLLHVDVKPDRVWRMCHHLGFPGEDQTFPLFRPVQHHLHPFALGDPFLLHFRLHHPFSFEIDAEDMRLPSQGNLEGR